MDVIFPSLPFEITNGSAFIYQMYRFFDIRPPYESDILDQFITTTWDNFLKFLTFGLHGSKIYANVSM